MIDRVLRGTMTAALFGSLLLGAGAASADSHSPYVSLGAGIGWAGDADIDGVGIDTNADFDPGAALRLAYGFDYANPFRSELELAHRWNDIDSIGGASGSGDVGVTSLMTNLYYDFAFDRVTPFIGAGIGVARVDASGQSPVGGSRVDDTDLALSAQAIAGVLYRFSEQWSVNADYRYFVAPHVGVKTDAGAALDTEYDNHTFMIGLRYDFGAPKAPAVVEPAPEPVAAAPEPAPEPEPEPEPEPAPIPRTYLVFFDWDRADLTEAAQAIIRDAAKNALTGGVSRIEATGHADRSGTDRYNMGLSQRRAEVVGAELARLGVPMSNIVSDWKGERQPLVETEDGVREPQNRRVEIVFP